MGLFDYVSVRDPMFVCSEGHDLSDEEFQSKDFGCEMGRVHIENGRVFMESVYLGEPYLDENPAEIYCTCRRCPAFVQFGTGNLVGCGVSFEIKMDGNAVTSIKRTSPDTADWLRDEPLLAHMARCEGPMTYKEAEHLHIFYRDERPEHRAAFEAWSKARAKAIQAKEPWPWTLRIGEYPSTLTKPGEGSP